MSWNRQHFSKPERKVVRHARVPFGVQHCEDCGRELTTTHQVRRFGGRCRPCWSSYSSAVVVARVTAVGEFAQQG